MQMEGACSSSITPAFQGGGRREGGQVEEKGGEGRKEPSLKGSCWPVAPSEQAPWRAAHHPTHSPLEICLGKHFGQFLKCDNQHLLKHRSSGLRKPCGAGSLVWDQESL